MQSNFQCSLALTCRSSRLAFFCLLVLLGISLCNAVYTVKVAAKDEECFYISAPQKGGKLLGDFDLLDDNKKPGSLSVVITDTKNERVLFRSRRGSKDGSFTVPLNAGQKVNLCVQNGIATSGGNRKMPQSRHDGQPRTVGLNFNFEPANEALELHNQNNKNVRASWNLSKDIGKLDTHYTFMRSREAKHRSVVERTFSRLMGYTILEGFVLLVVSVGQILYFRRFLERRRYM